MINMAVSFTPTRRDSCKSIRQLDHQQTESCPPTKHICSQSTDDVPRKPIRSRFASKTHVCDPGPQSSRLVSPLSFYGTFSSVRRVSPSYAQSSFLARAASLRRICSIPLERGMKRALNGSGRMFSLLVYAKMSSLTSLPYLDVSIVVGCFVHHRQRCEGRDSRSHPGPA